MMTDITAPIPPAPAAEAAAAPVPEAVPVPVEDYPVVEVSRRSAEETAAAENREPPKPSPGATAPLDMPNMTAATAPPKGVQEPPPAA